MEEIVYLKILLFDTVESERPICSAALMESMQQIKGVRFVETGAEADLIICVLIPNGDFFTNRKDLVIWYSECSGKVLWCFFPRETNLPDTIAKAVNAHCISADELVIQAVFGPPSDGRAQAANRPNVIQRAMPVDDISDIASLICSSTKVAAFNKPSSPRFVIVEKTKLRIVE